VTVLVFGVPGLEFSGRPATTEKLPSKRSSTNLSKGRAAIALLLLLVAPTAKPKLLLVNYYY
jgi:hypothetical protein